MIVIGYFPTADSWKKLGKPESVRPIRTGGKSAKSTEDGEDSGKAIAVGETIDGYTVKVLAIRNNEVDLMMDGAALTIAPTNFVPIDGQQAVWDIVTGELSFYPGNKPRKSHNNEKVGRGSRDGGGMTFGGEESESSSDSDGSDSDDGKDNRNNKGVKKGSEAKVSSSNPIEKSGRMLKLEGYITEFDKICDMFKKYNDFDSSPMTADFVCYLKWVAESDDEKVVSSVVPKLTYSLQTSLFTSGFFDDDDETVKQWLKSNSKHSIDTNVVMEYKATLNDLLKKYYAILYKKHGAIDKYFDELTELRVKAIKSFMAYAKSKNWESTIKECIKCIKEFAKVDEKSAIKMMEQYENMYGCFVDYMEVKNASSEDKKKAYMKYYKRRLDHITSRNFYRRNEVSEPISVEYLKSSIELQRNEFNKSEENGVFLLNVLRTTFLYIAPPRHYNDVDKLADKINAKLKTKTVRELDATPKNGGKHYLNSAVDPNALL